MLSIQIIILTILLIPHTKFSINNNNNIIKIIIIIILLLPIVLVLIINVIEYLFSK